MADAPTTTAATKERSRNRLALVLVGVIVLFSAWFVWKLFSWNPNYVILVDQANRFVLKSDEGLYLIGVEPPPVQEKRVGEKACAYVSQRILNKYIRLVPGRPPGDKDAAGWYLAYVYYTGDDGKEHFLNEELLRLGYARLRLEYPNDKEFRPLFEAAEAEAKAKKLGVWQDGYVFPGR